MRLIDVNPGTEARVGEVRAPEDALLRLSELGLRPGVVVRVIQRVSSGGRLLGVGGARLAIDRATARSVEVEVVS